MALANLLEHPKKIRPELMSGLIRDRQIKRSNKDLGCALAIARLSVAKDEDALLAWPELWQAALADRFPEDWKGFAPRSGAGLRQLLDSPPDLDPTRDLQPLNLWVLGSWSFLGIWCLEL